MHNTASIAWLSAWLVRFLDSLGHKGPEMIAGRDIGGGVAQHLLIGRSGRYSAPGPGECSLVRSWPAPTVARHR